MERKPLLGRSGGYLMGCFEDTGGSTLPEGVIDPWVLPSGKSGVELKGSEMGIKIRMFPKIVGFPPKWIHFNRVFHYFHHPFWGPTPIFANTHKASNLSNHLGILGEIEGFGWIYCFVGPNQGSVIWLLPSSSLGPVPCGQILRWLQLKH